MLNSLYLEAAKKRGTFSDVLPEFENKSNISEKWEDLEFEEFSQDFPIAAGDGSYNKKNYISFIFYAIASETLIFNNELKKIESAEIDHICRNDYAEDLFRNYMGILETKSTLKTLEDYDVDYYLYDGSFFGDLIRPSPIGKNLDKNRKDLILFNTKEDLQKKIDTLKVEVSSSKLIDYYYKNHPMIFEYNMYLSHIEKLLVLSKLLNHKEKLISISKTSSNNEIFESNIPDIAIFDKYTHHSGISQMIYKDISKEAKHVFPVNDELFKSLTFTIFYLRLENDKNVLKVELPYKASKEDVMDIISKIKRYSVDGYPYLLRKAHKDVVISNKNIKELANIMNIYEKSGREMLL